HLSAAVQTDPPREERIWATPGCELEDARALQEEVPLLREAGGKAGQIHLTLIALDLREVGVEAERGAQARRDAVVEVEADVARVRRRVHVARLIPPRRDGRRPCLEPDPL